MNYKLIKSSYTDIEKLIEYKKRTIFEYAKDLSEDEINRINNYVKNNVPKSLNDYSNIVVDNKVIGCLLLTDKDDGILLDEIYLEEEYRNKGIGTNIIKNVIEENNIVYLWVYKENLKAISLYKNLGFTVIEETDSRYYMKHNK
jgi:ribosomal protein S18 acetylase RimI-like enzyme